MNTLSSSVYWCNSHVNFFVEKESERECRRHESTTKVRRIWLSRGRRTIGRLTKVCLVRLDFSLASCLSACDSYQARRGPVGKEDSCLTSSDKGSLATVRTGGTPGRHTQYARQAGPVVTTICRAQARANESGRSTVVYKFIFYSLGRAERSPKSIVNT